MTLGVALFAVARVASAQACCTATGSSELGVVEYQKSGVVAAQLGYDRGLGSFDARGNYESLGDAQVDDLTLTLAAGVRPAKGPLQVHGALPLRLQRRELSGVPASTRFGPGDATLNLRLTLLEDTVTGIDVADLRSLVPFVEPFVGVRAPTGRGPSDAETPSQADVTGEGAWAVLAGAKVTKFLTRRHSLALTGSYARRFPHDVSDASGKTHRFAPGDEIDTKLAYLFVPDLYWSFMVFGSARFTLASATDGVRATESDTRRVRAGAGLAHYLAYPAWQLVTNVTLDPPLRGLGKSVPFAGVSGSLGLQRIW